MEPEQVIELTIRATGNFANAEYILGRINALLSEEPGARLVAGAIYPAEIFDAPLEIEAVPA